MYIDQQQVARSLSSSRPSGRGALANFAANGWETRRFLRLARFAFGSESFLCSSWTSMVASPQWRLAPPRPQIEGFLPKSLFITPTRTKNPNLSWNSVSQKYRHVMAMKTCSSCMHAEFCGLSAPLSGPTIVHSGEAKSSLLFFSSLSG